MGGCRNKGTLCCLLSRATNGFLFKFQGKSGKNFARCCNFCQEFCHSNFCLPGPFIFSTLQILLNSLSQSGMHHVQWVSFHLWSDEFCFELITEMTRIVDWASVKDQELRYAGSFPWIFGVRGVWVQFWGTPPNRVPLPPTPNTHTPSASIRSLALSLSLSLSFSLSLSLSLSLSHSLSLLRIHCLSACRTSHRSESRHGKKKNVISRHVLRFFENTGRFYIELLPSNFPFPMR